MPLKYQIILFGYFILAITVIAQQDDCFPHGIKLGLGDNWDKNKNYDTQKLSISVQHDYSISYFIKKECLNNSITIIQHGNSFQLQPTETLLLAKKIKEKDFSGNEIEKDFSIYIQTYKFDTKSFIIQENSFISYQVNYQSNTSVKLKRGPFNFFHHGQNKLLNNKFSFLWISDFDTKINNNGVNYGKDNLNNIIKYFGEKKTEVVTILGGGDYAYDLHSNFGQDGLDFMEETESLFSYLPFLPIAGNHESNFPLVDFAYFNSYYRTPNFKASNNERFTASFGRVLVIGLNVNYYNQVTSPKYGSKYPKILEFNKQKLEDHIAWLKKTIQDLKDSHDWVVVYSHMNMMCSEQTVECVENTNQFQSLQDVMVEQKVDIYIAGHIHSYERIHPNYKNEKRYQENSQCNSKKCQIYDKPTAPVYIVDGTGGNQHMFSEIPQPQTNPIQFSVVRDQDVGFSVFTLVEKNELLFQHYKSKTMEVSDSFSIKKNIEISKSETEEDEESSELDKGMLAGVIIIGIFIVSVIVFILFYLKIFKKKPDFIKAYISSIKQTEKETEQEQELEQV